MPTEVIDAAAAIRHGQMTPAPRYTGKVPPLAFAAVQLCRSCDGFIPREHFAEWDSRDKGTYLTAVYCDHCGTAQEVVWEFDGRQWKHRLVSTNCGEKAERVRKIIEEATACDPIASE